MYLNHNQIKSRKKKVRKQRLTPSKVERQVFEIYRTSVTIVTALQTISSTNQNRENIEYQVVQSIEHYGN